jgi:hypothetical protein
VLDAAAPAKSLDTGILRHPTHGDEGFWRTPDGTDVPSEVDPLGSGAAHTPDRSDRFEGDLLGLKLLPALKAPSPALGVGDRKHRVVLRSILPDHPVRDASGRLPSNRTPGRIVEVPAEHPHIVADDEEPNRLCVQRDGDARTCSPIDPDETSSRGRRDQYLALGEGDVGSGQPVSTPSRELPGVHGANAI